MRSYQSIALRISTAFQQTCSFSTTHGSITQLNGDRSVVKISGDNVINFLQVIHPPLSLPVHKSPPPSPLLLIKSITDTHNNPSQQSYRAFSPTISPLYHLHLHPLYTPAFSMLKEGISMTCSSTNINPPPQIIIIPTTNQRRYWPT